MPSTRDTLCRRAGLTLLDFLGWPLHVRLWVPSSVNPPPGKTHVPNWAHTSVAARLLCVLDPGVPAHSLSSWCCVLRAVLNAISLSPRKGGGLRDLSCEASGLSPGTAHAGPLLWCLSFALSLSCEIKKSRKKGKEEERKERRERGSGGGTPS